MNFQNQYIYFSQTIETMFLILDKVIKILYTSLSNSISSPSIIIIYKRKRKKKILTEIGATKFFLRMSCSTSTSFRKGSDEGQNDNKNHNCFHAGCCVQINHLNELIKFINIWQTRIGKPNTKIRCISQRSNTSI